jgi:hypothetical protein
MKKDTRTAQLTASFDTTVLMGADSIPIQQCQIKNKPQQLPEM